MKTTMKLMLMLLVVASMMNLSSCKKNSQIVGKWKCTDDVIIEGDHQFTETHSIGQIWEFKENGELFKEGELSAFSYSIEGNNLTISETVTMMPNGTQLLSQTATIQMLTDSQLSFSFEYQGNGEMTVSRNMDFTRP